MDERLIHLYEQELRHLRETAREFGRNFPSKASALGLSQAPADPYVERLLEGTAFMAARVRLKLDSQFPQFTQGLLETIYPDFLAPVPSMTILRLQTEKGDDPPPQGLVVKRGSRVTALPAVEDGTRRLSGEPASCAFALAHDIRLLPVELSGADMIVRRIDETGMDREFGARAALRLRLRKTLAVPWSEIALDPLVVHLPAGDGLGYELLEHVFAYQRGVALRNGIKRDSPLVFSGRGRLARKMGFDRDTALLPCSARTFEGYRLLREYFALPDRFLFFELHGFKESLVQCRGSEIELILALTQASDRLEREVSLSNFELFCAPAINLFQKQFSQLIEPARFSEFHVIPDSNRPLDYEIYSLDEVEGFSESIPKGKRFLPFFQTRHKDREGAAFFSVNRQERMLTERERAAGDEIPYAGSEVFLSLVDTHHAPYAGDLQQLAMVARCTNRHLPIFLREGKGAWRLEGAIKARVDVLMGPTVPSFKPVDGEYAWKLLSLFSINYLALADTNGNNASALRELLALYADPRSDWARRHIEALRRLQTAPVTRPIFAEAANGHPPAITAIGRGLEITVEMDEAACTDRKLFLLGSILDEFFAKYVTMNSFTETVIKKWPSDNIWMRWPYRAGTRAFI